MMARRLFIIGAAMAALAACAPTGSFGPALGPDGRPIPQAYRISSSDLPAIQVRALDAVNALRATVGAAELRLNDALSSAAATHARDMSAQSRPWHFGSDGSSPLDRVVRAGYSGAFRGELISETFENELETITAWMEDRNTRNVLLDRSAREMGFAFYQEPNGKLWWTLVTGAPRSGGDQLAGGF